MDYSESERIILSYLVGALADGSLYHNKKHYVNRVTYYQHSEEYLLRCIEPRIFKLFGVRGHFYHDKRKDVWFYEVTSKHVYTSIKETVELFKSKGDRMVPSWIKNGNESIQYSFIKGFFDADGWYHLHPENSDFRVRFGQAEYYILNDIREMLVDKFICSDVLGPYKTKEGVKEYYELHLYGIEQVYKFRDLVKPCHPNKQLI